MSPDGTPSPIDRALPETHLAALAHNFQLEKFIQKPKERREKYFRLIAKTNDSLMEALGYPPPDLDLRDIVIMALAKDRSFLAFVINNGGSAQVSTESGGDDAVRAGAGAILCDYLRENGADTS